MRCVPASRFAYCSRFVVVTVSCRVTVFFGTVIPFRITTSTSGDIDAATPH